MFEDDQREKMLWRLIREEEKSKDSQQRSCVLAASIFTT